MAWYRARPCLVQDLFAFFDTFFPAFVSSSCWRTLQCPGYLASLPYLPFLRGFYDGIGRLPTVSRCILMVHCKLISAVSTQSSVFPS